MDRDKDRGKGRSFFASLVNSSSGKRVRRAALVGLFMLGLSGCSSRLDGEIDIEGPPGRPPGSECSGTEKRCAGRSLQTCDRGTFTTTEQCAPDQICEVSLGCVKCNPIAATSCQGDVVYKCNGDGSLGEKVETCKPGACAAGKCGDVCTAAGTDLIYLVDDGNRLISFNPRDMKYEFKVIGRLSCSAGRGFDGSTATPFSMSVDRDGQAWVLYSSGEIFWVDTKDASCKPNTFQKAQMGFQLFGMGFVSDAEGSDQETLFIGGGGYSERTRGDLGSVDSAALTVKKIGPLRLNGQSTPELTGTGKGELYGYFPGDRAFIAQIDKATGNNLRTWNVSTSSGTPTAWAFAHWGGLYFMFIETSSSSAAVYMFDPATGMTKKLMNSPYRIVGAGVSTCAPVIIG